MDSYLKEMYSDGESSHGLTHIFVYLFSGQCIAPMRICEE